MRTHILGQTHFRIVDTHDQSYIHGTPVVCCAVRRVIQEPLFVDSEAVGHVRHSVLG